MPYTAQPRAPVKVAHVDAGRCQQITRMVLHVNVGGGGSGTGVGGPSQAGAGGAERAGRSGRGPEGLLAGHAVVEG
jgi:hypothetical protein